MKRSKKIRRINTHKPRLVGLIRLFQKAGLVKENGRPTTEGRKALQSAN